MYQQWSAKCASLLHQVPILQMEDQRWFLSDKARDIGELTNGNWLNPNTFLKMRICCIVSVLTVEHLFAAQSVYKCCSTWWKSNQPSSPQYGSVWLSLPVPEAPQTIRQN